MVELGLILGGQLSTSETCLEGQWFVLVCRFESSVTTYHRLYSQSRLPESPLVLVSSPSPLENL